RASVPARSASDVWTVGTYTDASFNSVTLIEHWNGSSWSIVPSPTVGADSQLIRVAALAGNDVWAVGYGALGGGGYQTLIEHWNGTAWSIVSSPDIGQEGDYLLGIAAVTPGNVWAVGYYTTTTFAYQTLIEHWNGSTWSIVPSPSNSPNDNLNSVAAIAANDVWAVGYAATAQVLIEHYGYLHVQPSRETPAQRFWQLHAQPA